MRFKALVFVLVAVISILILASRAALFLVIDDPEKADAILVLAGDTKARPERALQLLQQGFAPRVILDVERRDVVYDESLIDLAQSYILKHNEGSRISVCPISGLSTYGESDDVNRCLHNSSFSASSPPIHRVLIVTSEFHTRRALMIFRHHLPQYEFYVAAARNPTEFGQAWWTNREWAKTTFQEWSKLIWWEAVDRWS